eukprot:PhM_4_TR13759/c0_g1_i1/m.36528
MEDWCSASVKNVCGALRVLPPSDTSHARVQWVSTDGKTRHEIVVAPSNPPEVFVSKKADSTKMKLVEFEASSPARKENNIKAQLVVDFASVPDRDNVSARIKMFCGSTSTSLDSNKATTPATTSKKHNDQPIMGPTNCAVVDSLQYEVSAAAGLELVTRITPQLIRDIFTQYPAVLMAYRDAVACEPPKLSEEVFWRNFCCSRYFTLLGGGTAPAGPMKRGREETFEDVCGTPRLFDLYEEKYQAEQNARSTMTTTTGGEGQASPNHDPTTHVDRLNVEVVPSPGYGTRNASLVVNVLDDAVQNELRPLMNLSHTVVSAAAPHRSSYVNTMDVQKDVLSHGRMDDLERGNSYLSDVVVGSRTVPRPTTSLPSAAVGGGVQQQQHDFTTQRRALEEMLDEIEGLNTAVYATIRDAVTKHPFVAKTPIVVSAFVDDDDDDDVKGENDDKQFHNRVVAAAKKAWRCPVDDAELSEAVERELEGLLGEVRARGTGQPNFHFTCLLENSMPSRRRSAMKSAAGGWH